MLGGHAQYAKGYVEETSLSPYLTHRPFLQAKQQEKKKRANLCFKP